MYRTIKLGARSIPSVVSETGTRLPANVPVKEELGEPAGRSKTLFHRISARQEEKSDLLAGSRTSALCSTTHLLHSSSHPLSPGAPMLAAFLVISACAVSLAQPGDEPSNVHATDDRGGAAVDDDDFDMDDIDLLELEVPVVVSASRRPQRLDTVPYAMSVITAADIRASGAHSIPDALRLVPGVDVADLTFGNAAVSPRGFHGFIASQVLVLVDGRQIYDSLFGGTVWGHWPFQMEDIERIEVIRGPGGVTWGANAVNGVINIITKDPGDQLGLTMSSRGGSRGTLGQRVAYGFRDGKLRVRVSAEYESSDGFNKGGSFLRSLDDDYKGGRLALHAIYDHGPDDTITISAGSAFVDGGFPATPQAGLGVRRNPGSQASYVLGKWVHRTSPDSEFEVTGYVNDFYASPGIPQIDYRYQQIGLQFAQTLRSEDNHTRTWGVDTRIDLLDGGNASPFMLSKNFVTTGIVGLYLQDEWRVAPKWMLSLGGRVDYEFYGGFQPSARDCPIRS